MISDNINKFYSVLGSTEGELKEKGSRFIGYVEPVNSKLDIEIFLNRIKSEHLKARHHCYAYKIGTPCFDFRANDDGEPSGTAGKPILGQLESFNLTNAMCIVVRYFGGVLLGSGGLIKAYKGAAKIALAKAKLLEIIPTSHYHLIFKTDLLPMIMNALKRLEIKIVSNDGLYSGILVIELKNHSMATDWCNLKALTLGISYDHALVIESEDLSLKLITDS